MTARFRRYLVGLGLHDVWVPWAEFTDFARVELCKTVVDSVQLWRQLREPVLGELQALGLTATVVRTDADMPIGKHDSDLSGLVRLHAAGTDLPEPSLSVSQWHDRTPIGNHTLRMLAAHGLFPGHAPLGLRRFCGQHSRNEARPRWMDHVRTWLDAEGFPVLSVEPYGYEPAGLAAEVAAYIERWKYPLHVSGPHPGIWQGSASLVLLSYDCEAKVLPDIHRVYDPMAQKMVMA